MGTLRGVTPTGLPFPESTDPANQGANDIKALALAVDSRLVGGAGATGAPRLWVGNLGSVALNATYKFTTVGVDTHAGWDAANGRYKVPVTGLYLVTVHTMTNNAGGYDEPAIQTATSVSGTYSTKLRGGNPTNAPFNSMMLTGVLALSQNHGVRVMEGGAAWVGYNTDSATANNYLQITYLSST